MRVVDGYVHHNGRIGVLVNFQCGSDFTSRTPEFKEVTRNVCMALAFYSITADDAETYIDDPDSDDAPLVHDATGTVKSYLEEASKLFKEPISIVAWQTLSHDDEYGGDDDGV